MANLKRLKENNFSKNNITNLYLDNEKYDQLRKKMLSSAQNLEFNPESALLMQEQMNGTESSQLMIDMWEEYTTTTDNFRDFHVNVVDPSLIQLQNSINKTDEDIADELNAQVEVVGTVSTPKTKVRSLSPFAGAFNKMNEIMKNQEDNIYEKEDFIITALFA